MTFGGQNTEKQAHELLSYAFDQGINFYDTAEMYPIPTSKETQGLTDKYIGSWLKATGNRSKIVLATKVSGYSERLAYCRTPERPPRVSRRDIAESVDKSLQRLGVDTIDLLQIHWPDRYLPLFGAGTYDPKMERKDDVPFDEQLRGMEDVIKAGKVRCIGVSNESSWGVTEFAWAAKLQGLPKIQTIQNSYSLLNRGPYETDLAETCRRHNVSLLAYSPLAGGMLTGKYNDPKQDLSKARLQMFQGYMERYKQSLVKEAVSEYAKVAAKFGMTATDLALAWCYSRWFCASTIIGATTIDQLKQDLDGFDKELSPECLTAINGVFKRYRDPTVMG